MLESTAQAVKLAPQYSPLRAKGQLPPWIDIVAFSPTKWDDTYERPRQLMRRCAENRRVFFFEEPKFDAQDEAYLELKERDGVNIVIPHLHISESAPTRSMSKLIDLLLSLAGIHQYVFWYFGPFAVQYTGQFSPRCVVYDCINEPAWLRTTVSELFEQCERELCAVADVIFTADLAYYLATCRFHNNIHLFVDAENPRKDDWDKLWKEMNRVVNLALSASGDLKWLEQRA